MYVYEQYSEQYKSDPTVYCNEVLDCSGFEGMYSCENKNDRDISDWLILFRKAGFDTEHVETSPVCELTDHEKSYLSKNLDFLDTMPVQIIMDGDENYPSNFNNILARKRPRALFCVGNMSMFNQPSIFVCGARTASDFGRELAYKCGRLAAEAGYIVISGYAKGIDIAAHLGALEAGGATVAMLPYGLSRFSVRRALRDIFDPERFLAVSELPPSCGFMVKAALRRNKLLVALAAAVIVVEPGESGGTWHSAVKASSLHKPLFFHEGARPEIIGRMESIGGRHLEIRNGAPQLDEVYEQCGVKPEAFLF